MRIAIVSDLHYHALRELQRSFLVHGVDRGRKLDPVLSLLDLIQGDVLAADVLMCPGDMTDACDLVGLEQSQRSLLQIARALGVKRTMVTVGNHDVDSRDLHKTGPFTPLQTTVSIVPIDSIDAAAAFWRDGFYLDTIDSAAFLIVNSAATHTSTKAAEHGMITEETLDKISLTLSNLTDSSRIRIALMHHHPHLHEDLGLGTHDVMVNGSQLCALLEQHGFQLMVHGHKHHPKLSYAQGGGGSPAVLAAGSLSAIASHVLASNVRNLFHLIDLDVGSIPYCHGCGFVRSWEFNAGRGWHPSSLRSAGFPHLTGFGCRLPPLDIANQIGSVLAGSRRRWTEVIALLPHLEYMIPRDLSNCFRLLDARVGARIHFDEFGDPVEVAT